MSLPTISFRNSYIFLTKNNREQQEYEPLCKELFNRFSLTRTCAWEKCNEPQEPKKTRKYCNGCKVYYYCSKKCQKKDWKENHKEICPRYRKKTTEVDYEEEIKKAKTSFKRVNMLRRAERKPFKYDVKEKGRKLQIHFQQLKNGAADGDMKQSYFLNYCVTKKRVLSVAAESVYQTTLGQIIKGRINKKRGEALNKKYCGKIMKIQSRRIFALIEQYLPFKERLKKMPKSAHYATLDIQDLAAISAFGEWQVRSVYLNSILLIQQVDFTKAKINDSVLQQTMLAFGLSAPGFFPHK